MKYAKSWLFLALVLLAAPVASRASDPLAEARTTIGGDAPMTFGVRVLRDGKIIRFMQPAGHAETLLPIATLDRARVSEVQASVDRLLRRDPVPVDPGAEPCEGTRSTIYRVTRSDGQVVKLHHEERCVLASHPSGQLLEGWITTLDMFQEYLRQVGGR